jgi:hypothetical protein
VRRRKFNPDRIKPRKAEDRRARRLCAGVLAMLKREIRQDRKAAARHTSNTKGV